MFTTTMETVSMEVRRVLGLGSAIRMITIMTTTTMVTMIISFTGVDTLRIFLELAKLIETKIEV